MEKVKGKDEGKIESEMRAVVDAKEALSGRKRFESRENMGEWGWWMERRGQVEEKGSGSGREFVFCGMQKLGKS